MFKSLFTKKSLLIGSLVIGSASTVLFFQNCSNQHAPLKFSEISNNNALGTDAAATGNVDDGAMIIVDTPVPAQDVNQPAPEPSVVQQPIVEQPVPQPAPVPNIDQPSTPIAQPTPQPVPPVIVKKDKEKEHEEEKEDHSDDKSHDEKEHSESKEVKHSESEKEEHKRDLASSCDQNQFTDFLLTPSFIEVTCKDKKDPENAMLKIVDANPSISLSKMTLKVLATKSDEIKDFKLVLFKSGNKMMKTSGEINRLVFPSGSSSGVKIKLDKEYKFVAGKTYMLEFSINSEDQMVQASNKCIFKPVIKMAKVSEVK